MKLRGVVSAAACALLGWAALHALPAGAQTPAKKGATTKPAPAAPSHEAAGPTYAQRFADQCASCHGANGRAETSSIPVLAGQPSFYVVTQLYLLREGRRNNQAMTVVAKGLTDADLSGFSQYIGTLPPVAPPAPPEPIDTARMKRGQELTRQYRCIFCHGADLSGGQQVPRLAGQHEEYVLMSLQGYKSGTRAGYTQAMNAVLTDISEQDVATIAYYAARLPLAPVGK